jgi:sugar lactone lactonase YvrE
LNSPRGIALDLNTNTVYVSDGNNHRIMKYVVNSTVGILVAGGNGPGLSRTQLYNPRGLYFDSTTNSLIIANTGVHTVVRWVIGESNWTLVAGNFNGSATNVSASAGSGSNAFNGLFDVTSDPFGNVYVADRYNQRVQFFRAGELNGTTIAGITGVSGSNSTTLTEPLSVALDSQLNLYVADSVNNRVQKFLRY